MKIVLFFTYGISLAEWEKRGLLGREVMIYEKMALMGHEVTFVTYGDEQDRDLVPPGSGIAVLPVYDFMSRPKNGIIRLLKTVWIPVRLRKEISTADLFKTNQMSGSLVAVIAKWLFKKPLLVRTGYDYLAFTRELSKSWFRGAFAWIVSALAYSTADHVHVATDRDRAAAMDAFSITGNRITTVPNWIATDAFAPDPDPGHAHAEEGKVLFVGRLNPQKNLSLLLDALRHSGYSLDIIGESEASMAGQALAQEATRKDVRVQFLGVVPNRHLPRYMNAYSVFVLTSHREGNPKALLEAMACGLSIAGTDVPGIQDVIQHEVTGLLCEPTPDAVRTAIERLMEDKVLRQRLGRAARAWIVEHCSLDQILELELDRYDKMTS